MSAGGACRAARGDDASGRVTQHLLGALSAGNVGLTISREVRVAGDRMKITFRTAAADGESITRTLTGQRIG